MAEQPKRDIKAADTFAIDIIDCFADLHPAVTLSWHEWCDLREMIAREFEGEKGMGIGAPDLVDDPLYTRHRRYPQPNDTTK